MTGYLEQLLDIFKGSVWDGNLISKKHRDELLKAGLVIKAHGWNVITPKGVQYLGELGLLVGMEISTRR